MDEKMQFAVLIDAENVSAKYAPVIFEELEKYGYASCRRIYGNWSKDSNWKESVLLEYSIIPIQQFSYTTGKNSTDMAMVIDAMDILYQNKVNGFCIITSDSDFTRLAMRLREENKYVIGMGESKTPLALTRSCNRFIHLNLIGENEKELLEETPEKEPVVEISESEVENGIECVTSIADIEKSISSMLNETGRKKVELGVVGRRLGEKYPDFDVRNYGYSKLSVFITEEMTSFRVIREGNCNYVNKDVQIERDEILDNVIAIIKKNKGVVDNLSVIYTELKAMYKGFDIHDYGYSRLSSFLRGMDELNVIGNKVELKKKNS